MKSLFNYKLSLFLLIVLNLVSNTLFAQYEKEAGNLVVLITGKLGTNDVLGAGVIMGVNETGMYIATANHVVRRGKTAQTRTNATELKVSFNQFVTGEFEAELMDQFDEIEDLAILRIRTWRAQELPERVDHAWLGKPTKIKQGHALYTIGHPGGQVWRKNHNPHRFRQRNGFQIDFEMGATIVPGNSGGGLFDEYDSLVGIVIRKGTIDGHALSIDRVRELMRRWRFPVSLTPKRDVWWSKNRKWALPTALFATATAVDCLATNVVICGGSGGVSNDPGTISITIPDPGQ